MDNQVTIMFGMAAVIVCGAVIGLFGAHEWNHGMTLTGLIIVVLGFAGGAVAETMVMNQERAVVKRQINKTNVKLAVNQTQINQSIHELHVNHNNGDKYRNIQAQYYTQTQTQRRLQNRLNQEKLHLYRLSGHHDDDD